MLFLTPGQNIQGCIKCPYTILPEDNPKKDLHLIKVWALLSLGWALPKCPEAQSPRLPRPRSARGGSQAPLSSGRSWLNKCENPDLMKGTKMNLKPSSLKLG